MAWVFAAKKIGVISDREPTRNQKGEWQLLGYGAMFVYIPLSSIKKLIGRELSWKDEPVELEEG